MCLGRGLIQLLGKTLFLVGESLGFLCLGCLLFDGSLLEFLFFSSVFLFFSLLLLELLSGGLSLDQLFLFKKLLGLSRSDQLLFCGLDSLGFGEGGSLVLAISLNLLGLLPFLSNQSSCDSLSLSSFA